MSRRKQQELRGIQRRAGVSYRAACNVHGREPDGVDSPASRRAPASRGPAASRGGGDDGWPRNPRNLVVGAAIEIARHLPGNSLPVAATSEICAALGVPVEAVDGDVLVTRVAAGPDWAPYVESTMLTEYEYGLEVYEVITGIDVDVELGGMPTAAAALLTETNPDATVVYEDEQWATVAIAGLPLQLRAEIRFELENAEVSEYQVMLREE